MDTTTQAPNGTAPRTPAPAPTAATPPAPAPETPPKAPKPMKAHETAAVVARAPVAVTPLLRRAEFGDVVSVTLPAATAAEWETVALGAVTAGLSGAEVRREACKALRGNLARLMRGEPLTAPKK